ncbi:MAG: phosphoglycerate dehydrogenase [Candidatus Pacearchaeota archaeon]|jgi:D-3-phosphoglycerate dehydrogenase
MKILVNTDSFGKINSAPRETLEKIGEIRYNQIGRKYSKEELIEVLKDYNPDIIIAGTEKYDKEILNYCKKVKIISRVGIGLDSVDLLECEKNGIYVTNTPDAPSNAVAELTMGHMLNLLRKIPEVGNDIKNHNWNRYIGRELSESCVGIIGYGRIGKKISEKLDGFHSIWYVNDIEPSQLIGVSKEKIKELEHILKNCDIITLHIPLNEENKNLISKTEFEIMKKNSIIINTSRGGIINEQDLYSWLKDNQSASAAIDVFEQEPYFGKLIELSNCHLSPHLGSCTEKSRLDMEMGAVKNIKKFLEKK